MMEKDLTFYFIFYLIFFLIFFSFLLIFLFIGVLIGWKGQIYNLNDGLGFGRVVKREA